MTPEDLQKIINTAIENEFEYYWLYWLIIIATSIIVSIIATLITSYLKEKGKNLATKEDIQEITSKVESVKQEYKKEFDLIQKQNDAHFSELKNTKDRYNSKQFEIYNNLWVSLIELKFSADTLWDEATIPKLRNLSKKVAEAQKSIEISSLLLENDDYRELNNLIDKFNDFKVGKTKLIETKYKTDIQMDEYYINEDEIKKMIKLNGKIKKQYESLVINLKQEFKEQIKGNKKGD